MTQSYSEAKSRGKARELLQSGWYEDLSEIDVAVLIAEASKHTIEIEYAGLGNSAHGRIIVGPEGGTIRISESLTPQRKKFVLAHELGHYLLHRDRATGLLDSTRTLTEYGGNNIETEANWFASELLLPRDLFLPIINNTKPEIAEITHLARTFEVPQLSTALQYVTYSPECCAVVFSYQGRPCWFHAGKTWKDSEFFINMPGELPKGSHAREVFEGKGRAGKPQKVSAGAWLRNFQWEDKAMISEDVLDWSSLDMMISLLWVEDDI